MAEDKKVFTHAGFCSNIITKYTMMSFEGQIGKNEFLEELNTKFKPSSMYGKVVKKNPADAPVKSTIISINAQSKSILFDMFVERPIQDAAAEYQDGMTFKQVVESNARNVLNILNSVCNNMSVKVPNVLSNDLSYTIELRAYIKKNVTGKDIGSIQKDLIKMLDTLLKKVCTYLAMNVYLGANNKVSVCTIILLLHLHGNCTRAYALQIRTAFDGHLKKIEKAKWARAKESKSKAEALDLSFKAPGDSSPKPPPKVKPLSRKKAQAPVEKAKQAQSPKMAKSAQNSQMAKKNKGIEEPEEEPEEEDEEPEEKANDGPAQIIDPVSSEEEDFEDPEDEE